MPHQFEDSCNTEELLIKKWGTILFFVGALIRIGFFFLAHNNGGDALARAGTTAQWLQHPSLNLDFAGPHWPPVHFWMMAGLSLMVRDVTLGSRLLSLVFGILTLWLVGRLARELYGVRAAVLSLMFVVFYSLHIAYSTTSSSEATYLALLLAALLCFVAYRRNRSLWMLALAGVLLTMDAGIRYEAWILIFLMTLLIVFNSGNDPFWSWNHLRSLLVFGFSAWIWPAFWMAHQWRAYGDPLFGLNHNSAAVADQLAVTPGHAGLYQLLLPPGVILLTLTPLAVFAGIYALFLTIREPRAREFAFIVFGFGLIQFRAIATGEALATARYTLTAGILLALLAGYGLDRMAQAVHVGSFKQVFALTAAIMVLDLGAIVPLSATENRYTDKFRSVSPLLPYPRQIEEVGQFLGRRLHPKDRIVIDNYNDGSNIIAAAIGLPLLPGDLAFQASQTSPGQVWNYIQAQRPKYVVFSDAGTLKPYLPLPSNCTNSAQVRGVEFKCLFQGQMYRVYSISYPSFNGEEHAGFSKASWTDEKNTH